MESEPRSDNLANSESVAVGQLLAGKYEVVSILGRGGMCIVYRVRHRLVHKDFALKMLDHSRLSDPVQIRRFHLEAKAAFALEHPSLVKMHDFGMLDDGRPYLVMDLVNGTTLADQFLKKGCIPLAQIPQVFVPVCFGLAYAHQRSVVHRDIKPSNIMILDDVPLRNEGSVKILDFGIAKIMGTEEETQALTRTGEIFGSPLYMSPEQSSGSFVDHRSDVYSLGCVLFEALTGTPPHVGTNSLRTMMLHQSTVAPSLREAALGRAFPEALENVLQKMLAKSAADRYDDLSVAAHELAAACGAGAPPVLPTKEKVSSRSPDVIVLSKRTFALTLVAVALGSVAAALLILQVLKVQSGTDNSETVHESPNKREAKNDNAYFDNIDKVVTDKSQEPEIVFGRVGEISSRVQVSDGRKMRRIDFPECAIGRMYFARNQLGAIDKTLPPFDAVGKQIVPFGKVMVLEINDRSHPEILDNAYVFGKAEENLFSGLSIIGSKRLSGKKLMTDGVDRILQIAQHNQWELYSVALTDVSLDIQLCTEMFSNKSVETLRLDSCGIGGQSATDAIAAAPLKLMLLQNIKSAGPVLAKLSSFQTLRYLAIVDCPIQTADLNSLVRSAKLDYLGIRQTSMANQTLQALLKVQTNKLQIDAHLTREQVDMILSQSHSKSIVLPPECKRLSLPNDERVSFHNLQTDEIGSE